MDAGAVRGQRRVAKVSGREQLRGTTQNDIVKEYLSRGTYIFPPDASRRLIVDMVAWCAQHAPKWNPINVCSYHLQEAGATPVQEIAYSLATAIGVLDAVRESGQVDASSSIRCTDRSRSSSTPASASWRRSASSVRWPSCGIGSVSSATASPTSVPDASDTACRSTRWASPRHSPRTTCSGSCWRCSRSRCRSALGLVPSNCRRGTRRSVCRVRGTNSGRCGCNRCLAFESDLLEYDDIFDGSVVIEGLTAELRDAARTELDDVLAMGGAFEAIDELEGAVGVVDGRTDTSHRVR